MLETVAREMLVSWFNFIISGTTYMLKTSTILRYTVKGSLASTRIPRPFQTDIERSPAQRREYILKIKADVCFQVRLALQSHILTRGVHPLEAQPSHVRRALTNRQNLCPGL